MGCQNQHHPSPFELAVPTRKDLSLVQWCSVSWYVGLKILYLYINPCGKVYIFLGLPGERKQGAQVSSVGCSVSRLITRTGVLFQRTLKSIETWSFWNVRYKLDVVHRWSSGNCWNCTWAEVFKLYKGISVLHAQWPCFIADRGPEGATPLMCSILSGAFEAATTLITAGARSLTLRIRCDLRPC